MMTKQRSNVLLMSGASLLLAACGGPMDDEIEQVTSAVTLDENHIVTNFGAQVAIGAGSSSLVAVWSATDTTTGVNVPTMAGQGFSFSGAPGGVNQMLRSFSTTGRPVSSPAIAWDSTDVGDTFLAVWQDDYSTSDSDIWGALTTNDGKLVPGSPFIINFDSDVEKAPTVMWVPDKQQFLVTYRRTHGSTTAISANWVSPFSGVSALSDIIATGIATSGTKPSTSLIVPSGRFLLTYNENKYVFVWSSDLTISGIVNTISNASGITGASNTSAGSFGLTWRLGSGTSTTIKSMVFPANCTGPSCATSVATDLSAGGTVIGLNYPVIAPIAQGYAIYAGLLPASKKQIAVAEISVNGAFAQSNSALVPVCGGVMATGYSMGQPGSVSAATPTDLGSSRSYLLYDTFCTAAPNVEKERVSAPAPANVADVLNFNTSN
jgi:hypothetical protein